MKQKCILVISILTHSVNFKRMRNIISTQRNYSDYCLHFSACTGNKTLKLYLFLLVCQSMMSERTKGEAKARVRVY